MDGTVTGMQGWIDCFPKARLAGVLRGVGINDANEAKSHDDVCREAYALGRQI